jgi:hypothetical protein
VANKRSNPNEASILIQHIPLELKERLKLKAILDRRSVNNTLLILLDEILPPLPAPTPAPRRTWTPAG